MKRRTALSRKSIEFSRVAFSGGIIAALFLGAGLTQARVQLFDRGEIIDKAISTGRYNIELDDVARRGTIRTSDLKVIAQSRDAYEFGVDFTRSPKTPAFFLALSEASGLSQAEIMNPALRGVGARYWGEPVSSAQAKKIREVMREWRADGVSLRPILSRAYPLAEAAAGLTGMLRDGKPLNGLEKSLDQSLSGQDGWAKGYVDRTGVFLPIKGEEIIERSNGQDVVLTIDSDLQVQATESLKVAVEANHATSGAAVVIEPQTGKVLAMANWPSYDPAGIIKVGTDLNSTYMSRYEPGSTFKTLMMALALDEGAIKQTDIMHCSGALTIGGHTMGCSHGAHGDVTLAECIAKSCNIAAANWALEVGHDRFVKYIKDLGLLNKPGLDLPNEIGGLYNFKDYAKRLQLANNGFGQAMNVTPLAMASAFAVLGNNGVKMKPMLIQSVGSREYQPKIDGQVLSRDSADFVKSVMVDTIEKDYGTGSKLRVPGYTLAGKTGTAQKLKAGGEKGHVASFVGFVPAENPRAVVLVMVDNPKAGSYYGGDVAGPVFRDIAMGVIRRFGIAPDDRR